MVLKNARHLPRKFNRRISPETRRFLFRRKKKKHDTSILKKKFIRQFRSTQRTLHFWQKMFLRTVVILVLACIPLALAFFVFSPYFRIQKINIQRTQTRLDVQEVQYILKNLFNQHIFTITEFSIANQLKQKIPDLNKVQITKKLPDTLNILVELDEITAKIRIEDPNARDNTPVDDNNKKRTDLGEYLTKGGIYIIDLLEDYPQDLPLIRVVDWSVRPVSGSPVISQKIIQAMKQAELSLKENFSQTVTERIVYLRAQEFHLKTEKTFLWFDMASTVEEQLQRYRNFLQTVDIGEVEEYIDLRLRGRIVYK